MLTLEEVSFNLIAVFEGLRLNAYRDSVGIWTIGYGHTHGVKEGDVITKEQALEFFKLDCKSLFERVITYPIQEGAALVSFGYNLGISTLDHILSCGDMTKILIYDKAGSKHYQIPGLTARRKLEYTLIQLSRGNK